MRSNDGSTFRGGDAKRGSQIRNLQPTRTRAASGRRGSVVSIRADGGTITNTAVEADMLTLATQAGETMEGIGAAVAYLLYLRRPELPQRIADSAAGLYRLLRDKYYVDEVYDALIVRPTVRFSDRVLYRVVDVGLIDGAGVNGAAHAVRTLADRFLKHTQSGLAQSYIFLMIVGTVAVVGYLLR